MCRRARAPTFQSAPSMFQSMQIRLKMSGAVKWFDTEKGYGFIIPDDGSKDVFVHQMQIHAPGFRSLDKDEPVEFDLEEQQDGKIKAVNVTGPDGEYVKGAPRRDSFDDFGGGFGGRDRY